ncbi:MAG: SIMPL domain-containing protein [Candidatus Zixiibacteriota bacterium]|nr:MAG: SIMPL domain-containing protein [candidate division Zixibacteria bacterium]
MKSVKPAVIAAVSVLLVWLLASAFAQEKEGETQAPGKSTILKFTGDAELLVDPDFAVITIGVETKDKDIRNAKKENDDIIDSIIDSALPFVSDKSDLRIDYVNISPRFKKEYELKGFLGYFIKNKVIITIRDLSRYNDFMTALIESGVEDILDISFRVSNFSQYKDDVRVMAMKAAHKKARDMANAIGQDIGPATYFKEVASSYKRRYDRWQRSWDSDMPSPYNVSTTVEEDIPSAQVMVGKIRFTARVEVDFILN